MPRTTWRHLPGACLAILALVAVGGCATGPQRFVVTNLAPSLVPVDMTPSSSSSAHGDLLVFEAPLVRDGAVVGDLAGTQVTVDLPDAGASGRELFEERLGNLVFRFGSVDTLVVSGTVVLVPEAEEITAGEPQVRAVIGGTGSYAGATGQVTSTRAADGTYAHAFEIWVP